MKSNRFSQRPRKPSNHERGYILITLIFFVAVLAISLATILPSIKQEILRDREEEMVHRGVQYTRAIRLYYKKNGRYPAKIEDLESSNNLRFLRKRYKDPTVKGEDSPEADFKILRFGDPNVQLNLAAQIPGQGLPGNPGANGTLGGGINALGSATRLNNSQNNLDFAQQPTTNDPSQNANASAQDSTGNPAAPNTAAADPAAAPQDQDGSSKPANNPIQGGGAMVGVVSTNANTLYPAIREYNKKRHYSEWQFIYDPQNDRGGLPNGPWQPPKFLGQAGSGQQQIGTPAGQISNPVGQPPAQNGANPTPPSDQQQ